MDYLDPEELHSGRSVLVVAPSPVAITIRPIEHDLTPEGHVAFETYAGETRVARNSLPYERYEQLLSITDTPVMLGYAAQEKEPGISGMMLAMVPAEDLDDDEDVDSDEPWKTPDNSAGWQDDDTGGADAIPMVPVPLGIVVRVEGDRKYGADLQEEARDILRSVVEGRSFDQIDRLLADLTRGL